MGKMSMSVSTKRLPRSEAKAIRERSEKATDLRRRAGRMIQDVREKMLRIYEEGGPGQQEKLRDLYGNLLVLHLIGGIDATHVSHIGNQLGRLQGWTADVRLKTRAAREADADF